MTKLYVHYTAAIELNRSEPRLQQPGPCLPQTRGL